jgi:hypothetical protein
MSAFDSVVCTREVFTPEICCRVVDRSVSSPTCLNFSITVLISDVDLKTVRDTLGVEIGLTQELGRVFTIVFDRTLYERLSGRDYIRFQLKAMIPNPEPKDLKIIPNLSF